MANYNLFSELELLSLLKDGNEDAFAEIYNRYFHLMYVHTFNRLRDKEQAKDIVQELFSALWQKRNVLEFKQNLQAYLYASVRNQILNIIARNKLKYNYEINEFASSGLNYEPADTRLRERQLKAIITKEIQSLPKKMRLVFELSRKENLSHKEIASNLGISEQTVRSHIKHALKVLRTKLGSVNFCFMVIYFFKI